MQGRNLFQVLATKVDCQAQEMVWKLQGLELSWDAQSRTKRTGDKLKVS